MEKIYKSDFDKLKGQQKIEMLNKILKGEIKLADSKDAFNDLFQGFNGSNFNF